MLRLFITEHCSPAGAGNLSLVAGQKHTLQDIAGRTSIPPTNPFPLLFMMLLEFGILWNYNQFSS